MAQASSAAWAVEQVQASNYYQFSLNEVNAGYKNVVGIFKVDDASGRLDDGGTELLDPTDPADAAAYRKEAAKRLQAVFSGDQRPTMDPNNEPIPVEKIITIPSDWEYFSFYMRQNSGSRYWYAFDQVNEDGVLHFRSGANGNIEAEDLSPTLANPWGEENDSDFNDAVFSFQPLPIPENKLSFVTFEEEHEITSDPVAGTASTLYDARHWLDTNLDGDAVDAGDRQWAVAYTRADTLEISAEIQLSEAWNGGDIYIKADGPGAIDIPSEKATLSASNTKASISNISASAAFSNSVKYYDNFDLNWQISFDGGTTWENAGTSSNDLYLTLKDPVASAGPLYNTVVHLGSSEADGETTENGVIEKAWEKFKTRDVDTVGGEDLHYYKSYICGNVGNTSTQSLLETGDGGCSTWANFFIDVLKGQGIGRGNNYVELERKDAAQGRGFIVKDWTFDGTGKASAGIVRDAGSEIDILINGTNETKGYPYINVLDPARNGTPLNATNDGYTWAYSDVSDDPGGVPGQSTQNPASLFPVHVVVQYDVGNGLEWFDPSYGERYTNSEQVVSEGTQKEQEAALELAFDVGAIAGYWEGVFAATLDEEKMDVDLNGDGDKDDIIVPTPPDSDPTASLFYLFRKNDIDGKKVEDREITSKVTTK